MRLSPLWEDRRLWGSADVVAGVTLAAVAIPEAMGYTKIAGMPVVTGIYTVALPAAVFALVGSSRHLVVGADSATAAILFAGLSGAVAVASPGYVALASETALVAALLLVAARLLRLGFLADFLSRTALIGFLSGVGIQVAVSQLPDALGIPAGGSVVDRIGHITTNLGHLQMATAVLAGLVVAGIVILERISRRMPAALIAVALSIAATAVFHLEEAGVHTVGAVAGGFPPLGLPPLTGAHAGEVVSAAVSIVIVVLAQSAATSRSFAQRHHEELDENRDLIALAAAEVAAGLSGTFPVNGSPTKTAVLDAAGGRSQLAQLVAAVTALLVLLAATGLLRTLPDAALAAIVFTIGIKLVDVRHLLVLARLRRDELVVALATLVVVVLAGVEPGIILAVVLSVLDYVRRGYHPKDAVMSIGSDPHRHPRPVAAAPGTESAPGLLIYRFDAALFFANADYFHRRLMALVDGAPQPLQRVVLDLSPVGDIDWTAGTMLGAVVDDLRRRGITVSLAHADDVRSLLDRYGILGRIGDDQVYIGLREAVAGDSREPGPQ